MLVVPGAALIRESGRAASGSLMPPYGIASGLPPQALTAIMPENLKYPLMPAGLSGAFAALGCCPSRRLPRGRLVMG